MGNELEKKILLLVDDDPTNIKVVHAILGDNYKIRVAMNGTKALDLAKTKPVPDLILLDVMMPEIDGYEVCGRLKTSQETRDIPVIFLTGKTEVADETRGFKVGAVDYIHKPFSPPIVTARVWTHLLLREAREGLARQLSAVNNELEMAREIQMSILPHQVPKIEGLDIAARYLPMTSVAGDFYDFIIIDEKRAGILVADVSGHGLPAALIASMLQVALTAQFTHASEPAKVLLGLNRALCGKFQHNFVTAAYIFVDMKKNTLCYAGAGHTPLLLRRRSTGSPREVLENGLILGQFPEATYCAVRESLEPGDRCVLYTDGILETKDPSGEDFGIERFMRFMENNHRLGANQFANALIDELSRWSEQLPGQGQRDDITLLVIDFKSH